MVRPICLALLYMLSLAAPAAAQLTEAQPGARIRLQAPGVVAGKLEGTILTRSADTLVVGGPNISPVRVPLARILQLEISRGKSRADGAVAGMMWGAPIMAAFGLAIGAAASSHDCRNCTLEGGVAGTTALFALTGAFYGAGIGALVGRERWEPFDLSPRTSINTRGGRIGIGIAF